METSIPLERGQRAVGSSAAEHQHQVFTECSHALTAKISSILHKFLCRSQQKNVCGIKADERLPSLGLIPTPRVLKRETELRKDETLPCCLLLLSKQRDPVLESIPGYSLYSESSCWNTKPPWRQMLWPSLMFCMCHEDHGHVTRVLKLSGSPVEVQILSLQNTLHDLICKQSAWEISLLKEASRKGEILWRIWGSI